jgi:hypothetical protein
MARWIALAGIACTLPAVALAAPPEVFAPGVISSPTHEGAPAFAPDGKTVYFYRSSIQGSTILVSHWERGRWTKPEIAPFSGEWSDMEPSYSPDGKFMVFVSNRPISGDGKVLDGRWGNKDYPGQGGNLWRIERDGASWGKPERLPDIVNRGATEFAPSVVSDGSVYFMEPDATTNRFRLFRSQYRDGHYEAPISVSFSDGSTTDVDPAVAPDESFMVFGSGRAPAKDMDLFIAVREGDHWKTPEYLGAEINAVGSDAEARLSPDHRTLYFSSERTIPIHYPRTRAQAAQDLERITTWDDGQYNIWSVAIGPLLDQKLQAASSTRTEPSG